MQIRDRYDHDACKVFVVAGAYLALTTGAVLHLVHGGQHERHEIHPLLHWLRDSLLAVPLGVAAVAVAAHIVGRRSRSRWAASTARPVEHLEWAVVASLLYALGTVPGNLFHGWLFVPEHQHGLEALHVLRDAAASAGPALLALCLTPLWVRHRVPNPSRTGVAAPLMPGSRPRLSARRALATVVAVVIGVPALATGVVSLPGLQTEPAAAATASCGPTSTHDRNYDVVATSLRIPFNRWGDHNPNGQVFVLEHDRSAMKNWHVPLGRDASGALAPAADPAGADNRRLRPRPLVLRANEGECVRVTLRNELNPTPGQGLAQNPRASIHVHGPSFDVESSDGSRAGWNEDTTVGIGETITYHWLAPKEGLYFFHDHATLAGSEADAGSNAHGLYGALAVEPAGSLWLDPASGKQLYTETREQSGELYVDAIIVPPAAQTAAHDGTSAALREKDQVAFRESVQISQDEFPGLNGQADLGVDVGIGMGFNYGVEPLLVRQEPINRCPNCVGEEAWLSSWPYGDPGLVKLASGTGPWYPSWHPLYPGNGGQQAAGRVEDPEDCGLEQSPPELGNSCWTSNVTHAYALDATKLRFAHAGPRETHVFHMHAHQWLSDPLDVGNSGYTPGQPGAPSSDPGNVNARRPEATTVDSQTYGPTETFTADLLFGAGSKPGTVGDAIFHCHLYPHFANGFWSLFRVHDALEDGSNETPDRVNVRAVQPLPDRVRAGDVPDPSSEFNPGYPRAHPGEVGWLSPQPLNGVSRPSGAGDDPATLQREDLVPASRMVADKALDPALLDAVQTIDHDASAGTFELGFAGSTTVPIAFNASAADVEAALEALPDIVDVAVSGSAGAWRVKLGLWRKTASLLLTADGTGLTGGTGAVTVTPSRGDLGDPEVADVAHRLAVERHVALVRHNPGYDPVNPPAVVKQPPPGAPGEDPCPSGAREVTYNVSVIQTDIVYNEAGWHDPQGRLLVLDRDVDAVLAGQKRPEPFFFRVNAGDCINFNLTNRLPNFFGNDDFLELIQTNMVGQHIHLVKFDVKGSDGSGNGWNPQSAAFSEDQRLFNDEVVVGTRTCGEDTLDGTTLTADGCRVPMPDWFSPTWSCSSMSTCPVGQTLHERWYADYELRTVFTHDHFFPAEDQNRGYFGALIVEPKGMDVRNSFTGEWYQPINVAAHGTLCGSACEGTAVGVHRDVIGSGVSDDFREYGLGVQDFVSLYRPCPTGSTCSSRIPGEEPLAPPDEPEVFPEDDPGVMGMNYANAPFLLRDTKNGVPVDPAYRFSSWVFGDPQTPLLQAYAGDPVRARVIMGAQEEQHVMQVHGMRWRDEPDDPGSPLVNSRALGVSDALNFEIPQLECGVGEDCRGDYLYSGTSTDDLWLGVWGIMRVFGRGTNGLLPLPDNVPQAANGVVNFTPTGEPPAAANKPGNPCPADAPVRTHEVIGVDAAITYNEFGHNDPYGLVYAVVEPGETPEDAAARVRSGNPEPMVLRANEGDCIEVTLTNKIDPNGPFALEHGPRGSTDGDPELVLEPSAGTPAGLRISLHPALVRYDVRGSDGATIGFNRDQTVGPDESILYRWYADDVTPGELGTVNLTDYGDVRGHRHHGLFAGLTIEPRGASYHDPVTGAQVRSAQQADIRVPNQPDFREFTAFFQDGLNLRDASGVPLPDPFDHPPTAEEPEGEALDAEDRGEKGFNYRNAPFHGRLGVPPGQVLDGHDGTQMAHVFSSAVHGDPSTPIFRAYAGDSVRMRVLQGSDKPRQHVFGQGGHAWLRQAFDDPADTGLISSSGGFSVGGALNIHLPSAGGPDALPGDHRYGCNLLGHHTSGGLWGLMRVYHPPGTVGPVFDPDDLPADPRNLNGQDNPHDPGFHPLLPLEWVQVGVAAFDDGNVNGTRQQEEPPVPDAPVELYAADGTAPLATTTTGSDGRAHFQVAPGGYDVKVLPPPDASVPGGTDWAVTTPDVLRVDASTAAEHPTAEFGLVRLGDLTVTVFEDNDGDNVQLSSGEPGLGAWSVALSGPDQGSWSAVTDADGKATFNGLLPGSYDVTVTAEPGWLPNNLIKDGITVELAEDDSKTAFAGFTRTGGLSVSLFNDPDDDGVHDPGERALVEWEVTATDSSGVSYSGVTDAAGTATFDDLDPEIDGLRAGTYTIAVASEPDWHWRCATASDERTWLDPGSVVSEPKPSSCDDAASTYTITLYEGSSHVMRLPQRNPNVWVVAEPYNDTNNDGVRQGNEKKLIGWAAELWDGTTLLESAVTGNDGLARFYRCPTSNDPGGPTCSFGTDPASAKQYTVKLRQPASSDIDWRPTPATSSTPPAKDDTPATVSTSVMAGQIAAAPRGLIQLGTVSVMVFHDQDQSRIWEDYESPLANRNVRLLSRNGKDVLAQKATNAEGYAAFAVAVSTDYQLEVLLPSGWVATTPLDNSGKPTTTVKVRSAADPTQSVDPVEFGQSAENDTTPPPTPTADPPGGGYSSTQQVTLSSESGATIRYTLDGTTPTATHGSVYSGSVAIGEGDTTLKAVAIDAAGNVSGFMTESYSIIASSEATASASPSTWTMRKGSVVSGTPASLASSDDDRLVMRSARQGRSQAVDGEGTMVIPHLGLTSLAVERESSMDGSGVTGTLLLYDFSTGSWEKVESWEERPADAASSTTVSGDPNRFVAADGEIRVKVEARASNTFDLGVDVLRVVYTYPT